MVKDGTPHESDARTAFEGEVLPHGGSMVPTDCLRSLFRRTLIVNGGYDRTRADAVIRSGAADLVSFGKAFLANPDLPQRLQIGAALNVPDPDTFYGGGEKGYVDYSAL